MRPGVLGLYWEMVTTTALLISIVNADKCASLPSDKNWKYYWDYLACQCHYPVT